MVVEPGVINLEVTGAWLRLGFLLCSRSIVAIGLQHRRECRREFGRRALPEIRIYDHSRPGPGSRSAGRVAGALGGKTLDAPGYDLAGVFVGSEGTLGIATKIILADREATGVCADTAGGV